MQCVAMCCSACGRHSLKLARSVLQCAAVYSLWQCVAGCCSACGKHSHKSALPYQNMSYQNVVQIEI